VFGSFARGALEPHDVDLDLEYDESDPEWQEHFIGSVSSGQDPYVLLRTALRGRKRGCEFIYNRHGDADFPMTLLWRRGDSLESALGRLHAITADPAAGRAVRDAMLPAFEGIDQWVPRPCRENIVRAVSAGALSVGRLTLVDGNVADPQAAERIADRWAASSPLFRAANAVVAYFEARKIGPAHVHLHGADIVHGSVTPYFAGFSFRYFKSLPFCFSSHGGIEALEVVHPTKSKPLDCLRLIVHDRTYFDDVAVRLRWG
jgi:hypothetical protein